MPKVAELAGYHRAILHANPQLIDDEGYDLDSDDNEERVQEALVSAREDNPYSSIHLERECSSCSNVLTVVAMLNITRTPCASDIRDRPSEPSYTLAPIHV